MSMHEFKRLVQAESSSVLRGERSEVAKPPLRLPVGRLISCVGAFVRAICEPRPCKVPEPQPEECYRNKLRIASYSKANFMNLPMYVDTNFVRSPASHKNWLEKAALLEAEDTWESDQSHQSGSSSGAGEHFKWLAVYIFATLVLVARAMLVAIGTGWRWNDCCMALGPPCIYFLVGVIVPIFSWRVAKSAPMMRIMAHMYHYQNIKEESLFRFMTASRIVRPLSQVAALIAPILAGVQMWHMWNIWHEGSGFVVTTLFFSTPLPLLLCTFLGLAGMLFFGSGWVDELALDASLVAIEGLVQEIEKPVMDADGSSLPGKFKWNEITIHHQHLNQTLTQLWDYSCAGGLWILRIAILLVSSLVLGGLSISHPDALVHWAWGVGGVALALAGVVLLLRLAAATARCSDSSATARSVFTAAREYSGVHMDASDAEAYRVFVLYLNTTTMGVTICDVMITYSLVFSIARKVIVYIPVALQLLGHFLCPDDAAGLRANHMSAATPVA